MPRIGSAPSPQELVGSDHVGDGRLFEWLPGDHGRFSSGEEPAAGRGDQWQGGDDDDEIEDGDVGERMELRSDSGRAPQLGVGIIVNNLGNLKLNRGLPTNDLLDQELLDSLLRIKDIKKDETVNDLFPFFNKNV